MGWYTAQCKMLLFCTRTIVKESRNFERKNERKKERKKERTKEEEEKHFGHFAAFWIGTFMIVFCATRVLLVMKTLDDGWYVVTNTYKFTMF